MRNIEHEDSEPTAWHLAGVGMVLLAAAVVALGETLWRNALTITLTIGLTLVAGTALLGGLGSYAGIIRW